MSKTTIIAVAIICLVIGIAAGYSIPKPVEKGMLQPQLVNVADMFNKTFEGGPPFGGSQAEYEQLFKDYFDFRIMETCHNSIAPRANSELFIELQKKE